MRPRPRPRLRALALGAAVAAAMPASADVYSFAAIPGLPSTPYASRAYGISPDGSMVLGQAYLSNGWDGFRWAAATGTQVIGANLDCVNDATADGSVAVGQYAGGGTGAAGYRWSQATGTILIPPLRAFSGGQANGISADGSVIVGISTSSAGNRAYVWDAVAGFRDLNTVLPALGVNLSGWLLISATAVSDDGRTIAGEGINPVGIEQAWVATIPAPTGLIPLTVLLGAVIRRRRPL